MHLSKEQIKQLQLLLEKQTGLKYTDQEAQHAGLMVMKFVFAKCKNANNSKEKTDG